MVFHFSVSSCFTIPAEVLEYGMSFFRSPQGPWTVPARHFWAFQSPSTKSNGLVLGNWIRIAWSTTSCFPALLSSGFPLVWLFSIYQRGTQPKCNTCKCNSASDCGWDGGPWNFWIAWSVMSKTTKYKCSWLDAEKTNFDLKHLYQAKSWATRMYTIW